MLRDGNPRDMTVKKTKGFTLIELLIVVAIIGIIAAIAIPNLLLAVQRSKQRRTMADMRSIAVAWEARNTEIGRYNAAGGVDGVDVQIGSQELMDVLSPTYIQRLPTKDAWSNDFAFFPDAAFADTVAARRYAIISGGHDGQISAGVFTGPFTNYDCDIVYSQGTFLSYPDGFGLK
jgi:type II secretion system protein G